MTKEEWISKCDAVTDLMKVYTRPYVAILASCAGKPTEIGTGTFIENAGVNILTCAHVAKFNPSAYCGGGQTEVRPGIWCADPVDSIDTAFAPLGDSEWALIAEDARPLSMSKFATLHHAVPREVFFFRGIADQNANLSAFGADVIFTGYNSQEKPDTGDEYIFEMLWCPKNATVTSGTDIEVGSRFRYNNPAGFSGSLVWNTRFVELGCDLSRWRPEEAVITGLLRRYDPDTKTLLVWRVEHLLKWLSL
jgi:hypothetical protein